jgi:hypothetical protein
VSVAFAGRDGSTALLGFGADSFVESLSGMVMAWRFWKPEGAEEHEHRAARLVGITFLILAAYLTYEAVSTLAGSGSYERSLAALFIAALSLLVMPTLFLLKRRTAKRLGSRSLLAYAPADTRLHDALGSTARRGRSKLVRHLASRRHCRTRHCPVFGERGLGSAGDPRIMRMLDCPPTTTKML